MAVNGELYQEDDDGEQWLPTSITGESGCNRLLHEVE
jgi:hypothetical protein